MGRFYVSGIRGWTLIVLMGFALAGCGSSGGNSPPVTNVQLNGIVVDGPVVAADVRITDADGTLLGQTTTDGVARFGLDVPVEDAVFPLTVTVTGGTNLVTGAPPEVALASFITAPWENVTANVTLFSTLVVGVAERLPDGMTVENIGVANERVRDAMSFGLDVGDFDQVVVVPMIDGTLPKYLKASETLAEMLRRTTDELITTGQAASATQVLDSLQADLVDGVLDGLGAPGADARTAAVSHVVAAQVLLESITNTLQVNDTDAGNLLDGALQQVLAVPDPSLTMDSVMVTAAALEQTSDAVFAAMAVENDPTLATISDRLTDIAPNTSPEMVAAMLPVDSGTVLEPTIAFVREAGSEDLEKVNKRPRGKALGLNGDPIISGTPPTQVTAGVFYSFVPSASDPEGDPLNFSIQGKPDWATFNTSDGRLEGTPDAGDVGTFSNIRIAVTDGKETTPMPPFDVTVSSLPNRAPTIGGTPTTQVMAGQPYSFTPTASDADGDALSFTVLGRPAAWASFNANTGELSGTPTAAHIGTYSNIRITVTDGQDSRTLPAFAITVNGVPNQGPSISGTPPTQVTVGNAYSFTPTASDPDGDSLSFTVLGRPPWASFNANTGRLSGTPGAGDVDTFSNIRITVTAGNDSVTLPAFAITVSDVPNQAPTISGTPATQVTADQAYSFTPTASDPDGDELSFFILGRPAAWASFDGTTGRLSGTPTAADVGTYSDIRIRVTDGNDEVTLPAFSITVNEPPNRAPTISGTPATQVTAGQAYSFTPTASDPDGDELSFFILGRPAAWASFDGTTGRLSGTPTATDVGTYSDIRIRVTDGNDEVTLPAFAITVEAATAPVVFHESSAGLLVMEAENFDTNVGGNGVAPWTLINESSASNTQALKSPQGTFTGSSDTSRSEYRANFEVAGTHYLWLRFRAFNVGSDSMFVELDNNGPQQLDPSSTAGNWEWRRLSTGLGITAGVHTIKLYRRESNLEVDRVLITTNAGFTPTDLGPAESPRAPAGDNVPPPPNLAPVISGTPAGQATIGQAYSFTPTAYDPEGDAISFGILGRPAWATFNSTTGRLQGTPDQGDVGTYGNIRITVTDGPGSDQLAAFSIQVLATATGGFTLTWDPPLTNVDGSTLTDLAGYRIYRGTQSGQYSETVEINNPGVTSYVFDQLPLGTHYVVVTSVDQSGNESAPSVEVNTTL